LNIDDLIEKICDVMVGEFEELISSLTMAHISSFSDSFLVPLLRDYELKSCDNEKEEDYPITGFYDGEICEKVRDHLMSLFLQLSFKKKEEDENQYPISKYEEFHQQHELILD